MEHYLLADLKVDLRELGEGETGYLSLLQFLERACVEKSVFVIRSCGHREF